MSRFNNRTEPSPSVLLLGAAVVVAVALAVVIVLRGCIADLFLRAFRPGAPKWYERMGARLAAQGRDFVVYDRESDRNPLLPKVPYLHRHYVTGRVVSGLVSMCLHHFLRSDEDWLHDHPWPYVTIVLGGGYWEHLASGRRVWRAPGSILVRSSRSAHMVELDPRRPAVWTLFIMGPRLRPREWGFRTDRGWIHWDLYLHLRDKLGLRPRVAGQPGHPRPSKASA